MSKKVICEKICRTAYKIHGCIVIFKTIRLDFDRNDNYKTEI